MKHYKFLNLEGKKIKSNNGNCSWKLNEWKHEDNINICKRGFHCSNNILDAFSYVQGSILAEVEVKGKSIKNKDKSVHEEMRLVKIWNWTKNDSVALSIISAELCINNFEKLYPNDKRPREAIKATKKWLKNPTKKNESAAWSAGSAAWAAGSAARAAAESAAWAAARAAARAATKSAAWAAGSAARAAESAARAAARAAAESAARAATWAAESAAWAATGFAKKINVKINKWLINHIKDMLIYK